MALDLSVLVKLLEKIGRVGFELYDNKHPTPRPAKAELPNISPSDFYLKADFYLKQHTLIFLTNKVLHLLSLCTLSPINF